MNLDYDTYFEYHDQAYIIIEKVANYYGIELKELRWKHYRDYMISVEYPIIQQWLKEDKIFQYFMNLHIIFLI